jgi:hypothetical protein
MAKKKVAKSYHRDLDALANEMYRLLIKCGMHLDGECDWLPDDLREAVANLVVEMDGYYVRKAKEK